MTVLSDFLVLQLHRPRITSLCQIMDVFSLYVSAVWMSLTHHRKQLFMTETKKKKKSCIHSCLPLRVTYGRYSTMHSLCCVTSVSQMFDCYWQDSLLSTLQGCNVILCACLCYTCKSVFTDFCRCTESNRGGLYTQQSQQTKPSTDKTQGRISPLYDSWL